MLLPNGEHPVPDRVGFGGGNPILRLERLVNPPCPIRERDSRVELEVSTGVRNVEHIVIPKIDRANVRPVRQASEKVGGNGDNLRLGAADGVGDGAMDVVPR